MANEVVVAEKRVIILICGLLTDTESVSTQGTIQKEAVSRDQC